MYMVHTVAAETRPAPPDAIDYDLLSRIDATLFLRNERGELSADAKTLQYSLLSYVRQKYDLDVIPIVEGKTLFDRKLGHFAVSVTHNAQMPDDVIVAVVSNGYTRQGRIVREAKVVVNQRGSPGSNA
jgi:molecular chaperone GrpE (heat shock protein)